VCAASSAASIGAEPVVKKTDNADSCPNCCSEQGTCVSGTCKCDVGVTGEACEGKTCIGPNGQMCSGHGQCDNETKACGCNDGFRGISCQLTGQSEWL
jgi:hypothetical protein